MAGVACASSDRGEPALADHPQFIDISVNNILLRDSTSAEKVLGENIALDTEHGLPSVKYCNKNRSEMFILFFHPGDIKNSFSEFTITEVDTQGATALSGIEQFITGKGIKLGISKNDVVRILGESYTTETHGDALIIKYRLEGFETSAFLKKYNMPAYYGKYKFVNDRLIEFSFGFEYP